MASHIAMVSAFFFSGRFIRTVRTRPPICHNDEFGHCSANAAGAGGRFWRPGRRRGTRIPEACNRDLPGKEARQRRARGAVAAFPQRGERLVGEHATAGEGAEHPQIGRGAGERPIGAFLRQQPLRRTINASD